jgi:polyisoprenoid-binding protein YceI
MAQHISRAIVTALVILTPALVGTSGVTSASATVSAGAGYQMRSADVVVVCPLTVGGSFEARTKQLHGAVQLNAAQPGTIDGSLQVDLSSLQTGIGLRDRHMRENYLEVQKGAEYATATLDNIRLAQLEGKTSMTGTLKLHGQTRNITGIAELKREGNRVKVQAEFPVNVPDYDIAKPSYLGVGVKDEVRVRVTLIAEIAAS